ncbi:MAG: LPS assembly lipoprotein LptE [Gammaproteobacteria bacterium]|nr:LPS assembly lipoprotein LptE [Gammaproteobacteria bacterium]
MNKRLLPIIITLLLLSACGFTLRGSEYQALSTNIQQLELTYNSSSNELAQILRRRLIASGVEIIDNSSNYKLTLGNEQNIERVVSVNRNARAGEYELTLISSLQLESNGEPVIATEIISLDQIYAADPTNAAAKTNESELVLNELRQTLVEQIMSHLQTVR